MKNYIIIRKLADNVEEARRDTLRQIKLDEYTFPKKYKYKIISIKKYRTYPTKRNIFKMIKTRYVYLIKIKKNKLK